MSDLVKRLRMLSTPIECEAADAIERKDAAIAELEKLSKSRTITQLYTKSLEELERKDAAIAELVETLRMITTSTCAIPCGNGYSPQYLARKLIAKYDK